MTLNGDERVDWFRVITELQGAGHSYRAIGTRLGVSDVAVLGWRTGSQPRHDHGERLLDMWSAALNRERVDAPIIQIYAARD